MAEPELLDVIELLIELPEDNLCAGVRGTIVESYDDLIRIHIVRDEVIAL